MVCDSPQLDLPVGGVCIERDCGLCLSCCKAKEDAARLRSFYWLRRKGG